ncbi:MAG: flagellar export protein FliJ [Bauldia sp.]|nr:flagellar export protein FliJ [Bauldia sp.]
MKSRESVVRLKQFQVEDKRRQVTQIETMIAEFDRMSNELAAQVTAEHDRTGISDPSHFAYSTFAKAASQRRDNLMASADELRAQLDVARAALAEAEEELGKFAALLERERDADDVGGRRGHPTALAG